MKHLTYADVIEKKIFNSVIPNSIKVLLYKILCILVLTWIIALSAKVRIVLPYTPVPLTMQTFTVLFLSMLLGKNRSVIVILVYIIEGICGLPVFSKGAGIGYLLGPTGGYILGFIVAGYVVGWLSEKGADKNFFTAVSAMVIGNLIIYFFGLTWLTILLNTNIDKILVLGMFPFLLSDFIKIIFAGILLPTGWKLLKKYNFVQI